MLAPWKKSNDKPRQNIKKQRHYFAYTGLYNQSYGFSSSHIWMWELDDKSEDQRIDAFELWCWGRFLRVPWTKRRSSQSILKEISPKYSLEELMMKLKPPDVKSQLPWKDPEAGKYWGHEKGEIVDEMVGWHYRLNGHEFEQTLGDSKGQGSLVCCSPWDHKELDMTKRLNNNINV